MSAEFSGEQKLRIVLESIIRGIPREDQCKKYAITPQEFQAWHDHLIKNGGSIYDNPVNRKPERVKFTPWYLKLLLTFSLLAHVAVVIIFSVWQLSDSSEREDVYIADLDVPKEVEASEAIEEETSDFANEAKSLGLDELLGKVDSLSELGNEVSPDAMPDLDQGETPDLKKMLSSSLKIPEPDVDSSDLASGVTFINDKYEGKHVVYLIDVGQYQLDGPDAVARMGKIKTEVLTSLATLSPNSYFNLVLCWNLREANALGKTILRASKENIKYASDWITSLGTDPSGLKEGRNQFYPKELLYGQPLAGVIGPWYGIATAMSFDPDLIFFIAGNMPAFPIEEVPSNDFNGLGIAANQAALASGQSAGGSAGVSPLIRATARMWLELIESRSDLPVTSTEIEDAALTRLGLDTSVNPASLARRMEIPWAKVFDNFLSGLELGLDKIPQIHLFTTLPEHVSWPTALQKSMLEFTESSRGSFRKFVPVL
jgi:hypothetical protein